MRRTQLKRKKGLKKKGTSPTTVIKDQLQDVLRDIVIKRDGGCILRDYSEAGACGGFSNAGKLILQAEHLNSRTHSISFAELDNIVCLCKYHHIFYKKYNSAPYWILVRKQIGTKRWKIVEGWILDKTPHKVTIQEWRDKLEELKKIRDEL